MLPSPEEESGALLNADLDEALDQYVRERAGLVKRLKELSGEDWQRTESMRNIVIIRYGSCSGICSRTRCCMPTGLMNYC